MTEKKEKKEQDWSLSILVVGLKATQNLYTVSGEDGNMGKIERIGG